MSLKDRLKRIERFLRAGQFPPTVVVLGLGSVDDWNPHLGRYRTESGVDFEPYVSFGMVGEILGRAEDLVQLRQLAEAHAIRLTVLPCSEMSDLWADEEPEADEGDGCEAETAAAPD